MKSDMSNPFNDSNIVLNIFVLVVIPAAALSLIVLAGYVSRRFAKDSKTTKFRDEMFARISKKYGITLTIADSNAKDAFTKDPLTNEDAIELRKLSVSFGGKEIVIQDFQFNPGENDIRIARSLSGDEWAMGRGVVISNYTRFSVNGTQVKGAEATFFGLPLGIETTSQASEDVIVKFIESVQKEI